MIAMLRRCIQTFALEVAFLYIKLCTFIGKSVVFVMLLMFACEIHAQKAWPEIALPQNILIHDVGAPINVNGLPMHITSFTAKTSKSETANWFRASLKQPLVENIVGDKLVLGKTIGQYFLSVQIQSAEMGSKVLVAVSDPKTRYEDRTKIKENIERILGRLPSGTKLISHTGSVDAGKQSSYVVVSNSYSEEINRNRIVSNMREDGLRLEREVVADASNFSPSSNVRPNGKTLFFKGSNTEAIAVISHQQEGTSVVFNTITTMDILK